MNFSFKNHATNILLNVHVSTVKIRLTKIQCLFAGCFLQMDTVTETSVVVFFPTLMLRALQWELDGESQEFLF